MPRDSSGNFTLVAGNPVLANTLIESNWANTTLADLAQAMTESLDRNGKGGMLAPFNFADGTMGAPSITFLSQTNTGIYLAGLNDMRVTVGALDVAKFDGVSNKLQVKVPAGFQNVAHSTADFDAQVVLANANTYLAPVVAEGSELLYGLDGRTAFSAETALKLADTSLQSGDNISELTNNSGYLTVATLPDV
ncbi:MAG: hypothetical protein IZT57_04855, partial [Chloroflexi bacterium]|nr:hypothetical protein [Chloroflexota bacterium]